MAWSIIFFILGCALLAEIIYCVFLSNSTSSVSERLWKPFGLNAGGFWGPFLRILLFVVMVALFYVAFASWF